MNKCLLVLCLLLLHAVGIQSVAAQNRFVVADSLWEAIPLMPDGPTKVRQYHRLAMMLQGVRNDSARAIAYEVIRISKAKGLKKGQVWAYNFILNQYSLRQMHDSISFYRDKFLFEAKASGNFLAVALLLNRQAMDLSRKGEHDSAKTTIKAISRIPGQNNALQTFSFISGSEVSRRTGDYKTAIKNALKSMSYLPPDHDMRVSSYTILSYLYQEIGDVNKVKEVDSLQLAMINPNSSTLNVIQTYINACRRRNFWGDPQGALYYWEKADSVCQENHLLSAQAFGWSFAGNSHFLLGDYPRAESLYTKSKAAIAKEDQSILVGECWIGLGHSRIRQSKYRQGLQACLEAYQLKSIQEVSKGRIKACKCLQEGYVKTREYDLAYQYLMEQSALEDSILKLENIRQLAVAEVEFEFEREQAELLNRQAASEAELEQQTLQRNGLILITGLIGLVLFLVIRSSRTQRRNNRQLEAGKSKLERSLKEKEHLLSEIHHRVKNNLQTVSGLLYLRARYVSDAEAREALAEGQEQLKSMVLIHQQLYNNDDLVAIDLQVFLHRMIAEMDRSHACQDQGISLETEIEKIMLNVDQATPLGLILFELVLNAIKHAFPDGQPGEIQVEAHQSADQIRVTVADNGIGIPEDQAGNDSYGMRLIRLMARELNCQIQWSGVQGTKVNLVFDLEELGPV